MAKKYVRKRQRRDPNKVLTGITHGRSGYRQGCGCDVCREAEHDYQQSRKMQGLQPRNGQSFRSTTDKPKVRKFSSPEAKAQQEASGNVVSLHSVKGGKAQMAPGDTLTDETPEDIDWPGKPADNGHLGRGGQRVPGTTEKSFLAECEGLSMAEQRPGMVAIGRQLAIIMDDNKSKGIWPTTGRQLQSILNDLRGDSKKKSKGRLARVQSMTSRSTVSG